MIPIVLRAHVWAKWLDKTYHLRCSKSGDEFIVFTQLLGPCVGQVAR